MANSNVPFYMDRVNTRIQNLLANIPSKEPDHTAGTWLGDSVKTQPDQVNLWAQVALASSTAVTPVLSTHPTGNWDSWQTALRATISGSGAPAWFSGGSQIGFTGDAPPEVITWVINHLPIVVVRDSLGMGLVVVLAGAEA